MTKHVTGSCECGAVKFQVTGNMRPVVACHCSQCRKSSGHFWAATQVDENELELIQSEALKWYRSSDTAKRAFCIECGSSLFWKMNTEPRISIGAGTLDGPTGLRIAKEIYTEDKGDYYQINERRND